MSLAAGAVSGRFGRVALLNIDRPVHAHAHPHAHVLLKVAGADSWFRVRDRLCPLTDEAAILVDSWEVHDYPHGATDPESLILALYIDPEWLRSVDDGFHACSAQGFFPQPYVAVPKGLGKLFHKWRPPIMRCLAAMQASGRSPRGWVSPLQGTLRDSSATTLALRRPNSGRRFAGAGTLGPTAKPWPTSDSGRADRPGDPCADSSLPC